MSSRFLLIPLKDDNEAGPPKAGPELSLWILVIRLASEAHVPNSPNSSDCLLRREKSFCKIFREVFRSFCEVFQSFRKFFEVFASFSRLSDPFGPIGMHSDAFGSNWKRLDVFENF